MNELIVVGISDYKISKSQMLATYALGSCIGTSIFDSNTGIGGLSHIMLPESKIDRSGAGINRMKYADTALDDMIMEMVAMGANRKSLSAKIAGGANMFGNQNSNPFGNIGMRNVEGVKSALMRLNIPIIGENTGADYGRTVFFEPVTGKFTIKSIGKDLIEL